MQKTKFISRGFFYFFLHRKKMQRTKFVLASFFFFFFLFYKRKKNAKNEKLSRSHEIISQSNFSIMSFERDNKSWPRDNQPVRLLLLI